MKNYIVYNERNEMEDILPLTEEQYTEFLEQNPEWTLEFITIEDSIFEEFEEDISDDIEEDL